MNDDQREAVIKVLTDLAMHCASASAGNEDDCRADATSALDDELAPLVRGWLNEAWAQGYNAHSAGYLVADPAEVPF